MLLSPAVGEVLFQCLQIDIKLQVASVVGGCL